MKSPLFIVLLIQTLSAALLSGNMSFGQCEPCQSWYVGSAPGETLPYFLVH